MSLFFDTISTRKTINTSHYTTMSMMVCPHCNHDPCTVELYKVTLKGEISVLVDSLDRSKKWNHLYRCFVQAEYGMLSHCIHLHISVCIVYFICTICPSTDGSYTGHLKTGDDNRVEDADDGSDENADIK